VLADRRSPESLAIASALREGLGIDVNTKVILYAPTFRDDQGRTQGTAEPFIDGEGFRAISEALPSGAVLLVRFHKLSRMRPPALPGIMDVSDFPDAQSLLLISDLLITDYSSVMFDYAVTNRPMAFYVPDLKRYEDVLRGFYFNFVDRAPGPLIQDLEQLCDHLVNPQPAAQWDQRYERFRLEFCPFDDGGASERVLQHLATSGRF
jgi:CDP-glycerol glycerophosphotransferase